MFTEVIQELKELPSPLIIAVSGGIDSMVLLNLALQAKAQNELMVVHIDHQIRSESHEDAQFVKSYCELLPVSCDTGVINVPEFARVHGLSLEAAARQVRYQYLESVRASIGGLCVLTAHHANDQAETVLMNIIRGSRLRGISGIPARQGTLIRPLLKYTRLEIKEYASIHTIAYREDSTNTDVTYLRNRIRHNILPEIALINPAIVKTITSLADYARELDTMMESIMAVHLAGSSITQNEFEKLSPLLARTFIERLYARAHNESTIGLSAGNIEELRRYILEANGSTVKDLGKLRLTKKNHLIVWSIWDDLTI